MISTALMVVLVMKSNDVICSFNDDYKLLSVVKRNSLSHIYSRCCVKQLFIPFDFYDFYMSRHHNNVMIFLCPILSDQSLKASQTTRRQHHRCLADRKHVCVPVKPSSDSGTGSRLQIPVLLGLVVAVGVRGGSPSTRRTLLAWVLPW